MKLAEYAALDGLGLAELLRTRQVAPREVAAAALAAVALANPAVQAVVETYDDAADALDEATLGPGPFRGVPFLIKDVGESFGGRRCEQGSRLARGLVVAEDDYFATLVKAAGVTLVGRSNTPEFSMALCAENLLFGNTTTPWKAGYSTSGSTGGGAAAVAAGMVPIAHGSDMGGSIRGPAAWCGTVGLYPSRGRVSAGPRFDEGGHGMTQRFVMTRTMRDTATMLDCLGRPQPGDPFVISRPPLPFAAHLERPAAPLRIGWSTAPLMDAPVDPEIAAAVEATARVLEGLGHHVEAAAPPLDLALIDRSCTAVWYFGFHRWLDDLAARTGRTVGPDTVERMTLRFYEWSKRLPCERYLAGLDDFNRVRRGVGGFFLDHDIWLSPTCAQVSRPFGTYGMSIEMEPEAFVIREERPCQFLAPYNVTGQPAISLPLAQHSSGLPIGIQLGARHGEEHLLLQLGAALEQAMPWRDRVPPLHVSRLAA